VVTLISLILLVKIIEFKWISLIAIDFALIFKIAGETGKFEGRIVGIFWRDREKGGKLDKKKKKNYQKIGLKH
jgi:hypothetical protein